MEDVTIQAVRQANYAFYDAFSSLSIVEMSKIWLRDDSVKCVHPGWSLLRGWPDVMRSWEDIFDNATMMQFSITDDEIVVGENHAWVTCTEHITSVGDGRVSEGRVQATNVYRLEDGLWMMVHHHGSPVM